jgi:hypothetical protein
VKNPWSGVWLSDWPSMPISEAITSKLNKLTKWSIDFTAGKKGNIKVVNFKMPFGKM